MWFCTFITCGMINMNKCRRNGKSGNNEEDEFDSKRYYSEGESDTEFSTPFNDLSTNEK